MTCKFHRLYPVKDHDSRALVIAILGFDDAAMMQGLKQFN